MYSGFFSLFFFGGMIIVCVCFRAGLNTTHCDKVYFLLSIHPGS